jgi:hypothetical protein
MGLENRLAKIAILVPKGTGHKVGETLGADVTHNATTAYDVHGKRQRYDRVIPLLDEPAIEPFVTRHGGKRAYGGGTSKKSKKNG